MNKKLKEIRRYTFYYSKIMTYYDYGKHVTYKYCIFDSEIFNRIMKRNNVTVLVNENAQYINVFERIYL